MKIDPKSIPMTPRERVVVFGGLGFIGSHICRALVAHGFQVQIFDRSGESRHLIADLETAIEIWEGDICEPETVLAALANAKCLINLIHTTVPGSSMRDPSYDVISNVASSVKWLERLSETKVQKILFFSSGGTVYGIPEKIPITEDHPTNPLNSYGITKLAIEKYTAMFARRFGVDYIVLRPSNVYGPGQRLHAGQGVIGILANRALQNEVLEIWGDGTDQRDYLYIDDLVSAVVKLLPYDGPVRVFNVSSGVGHSVLDVLSVLQNEIHPLPPIKHVARRGFDVPVNILDSRRLQKETGWHATIPFEEGIKRTIHWLVDQRQNDAVIR